VQPTDDMTTVAAEVSLLHWPDEEPLRHQLAWFGLPRVLLVEPGARPPDLLDELEDWMRTPADPIDLRARTEAVRRRACSSASLQPVLDDDGLLWMGASWVALTPSQAPVVRVLIDHLDKVVHYDAVMSAYQSTGGSGHPASVRTLVARLATRLRTVGLELVSVRRRGVLLTVGAPPAGQG
jgi:hypothetical protein